MNTMSKQTPLPFGLPRLRGLSMTRQGVVMTTYIVFLLLPIYWLLNMSLKTNEEILSTFSLWPQNLTFDNYMTIFQKAQ